MSNAPTCITIEYVSSIDINNTIEDFFGESNRHISTHTLKCLFKRDFKEFNREKNGLEDDSQGNILISPIQITQLFGSIHNFKAENITKIIMDNELYLCGRIIRHGFYPPMNNCVGLELKLHEYNRGGGNKFT